VCEQTALLHQGAPIRRPTFTHVPRVHSCSHHLSLFSPSKEVQLLHMLISLSGEGSSDSPLTSEWISQFC